MKMFFKIISVSVSALMAVSMLASCGAPASAPAAPPTSSSNATSVSPSASARPVTLTLLANQDWVGKPYMKAAWQNYEDKTGNKLDIQAVPIDSGEQVMETKFATGEIPDIFMHFPGYTLTPYKPADNFVDFSNASWVSDLRPYVLDQTKFNGKVYGLPHWEASISGMLYNKGIFNQLGITVPKTQGEFAAVCEKIKAAGTTPIYMAFKDVWPLLYQFPMDPMVKDQSVLDKLNSNQLTYAKMPEMTDMLNWYKTMADKGYLGSKFSTNTWDGAPQALGSGKYAMMYCWDTWLYSDLEPKFPGMAAKFGLMPAFMGTPSQGTYEGPNVCLTMVNKNGKNAQAAADFVSFLAQPDNYNSAFKGFSTAPVFKGETANVPTAQFTAAQDSINAVSNSSLAWPCIIGFSQTDGAKPIQDLMLGNASVADTLKAMDDNRIQTAKARQVPGF